MNETTQRQNKGNVLLGLLICGLIIFFLGSSITMLIASIPFKVVTHYDSETISEALVVFSNYFSEEVRSDGIIWKEYAQTYFSADPTLFDNICSLFCAVQLVSYMPLALVFFYFLRKDFVKDFKAFIKNIKKNVLVILSSFAAMSLLASVVAVIYILLGINGQSSNENIINLLLASPGKWLMIISVVCFAPIIEEILFRKLFIDTLEIKFNLKPAIAIIISCILFAFIHVTDLQSIIFIFQYIAIALPICIAYHYSDNNIFVVSIIHIANNLLSVITTTAILLH